MMPSNDSPREETQRMRSTLLSAVLLIACFAFSLTAEAGPRIAVAANFKGGKLYYAGRLSGPGSGPGRQVAVYDGASGQLLHAMRTSAKSRFSYPLPLDRAPCNIRVVAGDSSRIAKVRGAPANCRAELVCSLTADKLDARANESISFSAVTQFRGRKALPELSWDFGNGTTRNGAPDKRGAAREQASYPHAGRYRVTYTARLGDSQCQDAVTVAVAPVVPNLPPKVAEAAPRPANAAGMAGDYAVLPFSDRSDVGVGNTGIPFNQYQQTQSLNAVVFKKDPKKPVFQLPADVDVFYSAASNPLDPVGSDSINSTSQNWFADGSAGANYNAVHPSADSRTDSSRVTELLPGKNFDGPETNGVKKTGLYDRRSNRANNGGSDMTRLTSNPATVLTRLDEGARGTKDGMLGTQFMPGKDGAYLRNDEQKANAYADVGTFIAQLLPVVGVDDRGRKNPFPLFRVVAKNKSGQPLASADTPINSSSELSCAQCHSKGGISADDNVWFTPVTTNDPEARGDGSAYPNGSGSSYPAGRAGYSRIWAPAVQNRFEIKIVGTANGKNIYDVANPFNPNATNLRRSDAVFDQETAFKPIFVKKDGAPYISEVTNQPMILRGDRVKAYRFRADGKLQIQLNFVAPENDSPQAREKAALLNLAILHDYYDSFGPTNAAASAGGPDGPRNLVTQFADVSEDKTAANNVHPASCGGHHFSNANHETGRSSLYNARFVYSQYSRTMHAFHGRLQVYKQDVDGAQSADGLPHNKGELIRDPRGHHIPFGGAGWDPERKDDFKEDVASSYDGIRNNFDPERFPMHPMGQLLIPFDLPRDSTGNLTGLSQQKTDMTENCSICHAGKTEKVYHDVHYSAGLTCENCHGDMQAVGGLWLRPGKGYADRHAFRLFDYDQPDCGSCHLGANPEARRWAFDTTDKSATPLPVAENSIDRRFAVMPMTELVKRVGLTTGPTARAFDKLCLGTNECDDTPLDNNGQLKEIVASPLFRKSVDTHGNVPCVACHGPAHTIWPVFGVDANHNVTAKQLQGYDGTLMECDVCHSKAGGQNSFADGQLASNEPVAYGKRGTRVVASDPKGYLAGPHGLHPVNDPNWFADAPLDPAKTPGGWHSVSAKIPGPNGEDQCAACHGANHKSANRLAKTMVDREYKDLVVDGKKLTVRIRAGEPVNCTACHSQKISFRGTPWESSYRSIR